MTAYQVAASRGANLHQVHAGGYVMVTAGGLVFTVTSDRDDSGRLRWYSREGNYPGGPPFEVSDTLRDAVAWCLPN